MGEPRVEPLTVAQVQERRALLEGMQRRRSPDGAMFGMDAPGGIVDIALQILATLDAERQAREAAERELAAFMRPGCKCQANPTAESPTDCDYPYCGCDPNADRIIAVLEECGALMPREARELKARAEQAERAAQTVADECAASLALAGRAVSDSDERADALQAHNEALAGALRAVEWGDSLDPLALVRCCHSCSGTEESGHRDDCPIGLALSASPASSLAQRDRAMRIEGAEAGIREVVIVSLFGNGRTGGKIDPEKITERAAALVDALAKESSGEGNEAAAGNQQGQSARAETAPVDAQAANPSLPGSGAGDKEE